MRTAGSDPGDFRAPSGVMSAMVRRFHGDTESTNAEILRRGSSPTFLTYWLCTDIYTRSGTRAIGRQNTYHLFSSNCQRFAISVGHEIQIVSTLEFDLLYGQEMMGQAEQNGMRDHEETPLSSVFFCA